MGKHFLIGHYCENKFKNRKDFAYAEFDPVDKKVNCIFADTISFSLNCKNKYKKICKNDHFGCSSLGKIYATNLLLINSHLLEKFPPVLKCRFMKSEGKNFPIE